ncbi:hypothetical protein HBA92_17465 [Ochrobactrum sp. MR28]|nr:hypothetical protein [Ochrobactrum sp. MR28]MBX8817981.1 hypothetical protein [Ochrobactrum sp. MR31]
MIDFDDSVDRHAIPRWLSLQQSKLIGELGATSVAQNRATQDFIAQSINYIDAEFERISALWQFTSDLADAEELLAVAVVANRLRDDVVMNAANFVVQSNNSQTELINFAHSLINVPQQDIHSLPMDEALVRVEIAKRKKLINLNPYDSLRLTETALLYAGLGQNDSSKSLLRRAISLNPNDRYILRACARFFVHIGDEEQAISVLKHSDQANTDPWLKAAALAIEAAAGLDPTGWKKAKNLLSSQNFSERDLSELAVQMGTLELDGGSRKQAMKFIRQGALSPTENAIAQIEFVGRRKKAFQHSDIAIDYSLSHEASAYAAYEAGDWEHALKSSEAWHLIEPFSVRPSIFGSFVPCVLAGHLDRGLQIANIGLYANPKNVHLLNNVALLEAYKGNIESAMLSLSKAKSTNHNTEDGIMLIATEGLINFRRGDVEIGFDLYTKAIEESKKNKYSLLALRAGIFLARELAVASPESCEGVLEAIDSNIQKFQKHGHDITKDIFIIRDQIAHLIAKHVNNAKKAMPKFYFKSILDD